MTFETINTVMPRILVPGLYLLLEVKSGDVFEVGFNRGWGLINFFHKGRNLLIFFIFFLCCLFMKYFFYCLFNMLIFIKIKVVIIKN